METYIAQTIARLEAKRDKINLVIDQLRELESERPPQGDGHPRATATPGRRPQRARSQKPVAAAEPRETSDTEITNETSCLSPEAIALGRSLVEPFGAGDIKLPGPEQRPYWWINGWQRKGWIENVERGLYRRTSSFGNPSKA